MTLLEDIVQWLIINSLATEDNKDIFRDYIPDDPDEIIILDEYDASSSPDTGNSAVLRYVQVATRALKQSAAKLKCDAIYKLFADTQYNDNAITDLPNSRWAIINLKSPPIKTQVDDQQRTIYSFNVAITTSYD